MRIYDKSLSNVSLVVAGNVISEGGGESEFVTVTSPERAGAKTGVHGDAIFYDMPNQLYEVTITLLETSSANVTLQALYNAQVSRTSVGTMDFTLEDTGTAEILSGQCRIRKEPDRAKAAEAGDYQWILDLASATPWSYSERSIIFSI